MNNAHAHLFSTDMDGETSPLVLLVDDDQVTLMVTAMALKEHGFTVDQVESGQQALDYLSHKRPDVVVLDALMPGLDGFETCALLRARPELANLPVLMATGLEDDLSIGKAYQAGATDFFTKSTQWNLLSGRLRYLLRSARLMSELQRSRTRLAYAQALARMGSFDWRPKTGQALGELELSVEALRVLQMEGQPTPTLRALLRRLPSHDRRHVLRTLAKLVADRGEWTQDVNFLSAEGRRRILHLEVQTDAFDLRQSAITGVLQDVTERRLAEDKVRYLANFDALTGLPNRHQLMWRAERALDRARQLGLTAALLLIDLDRFKVINDTLGHAAGDELLVEVARRLRLCVRHSDQVLESGLEFSSGRAHLTLEAMARLGGDEFVALLPDVAQRSDVNVVAERILSALRTPVVAGGQECIVTASVGVALFPRDGETVADLMRNADMAMYSAKDAGRNTAAAFDPQHSGPGRHRLELEIALHKALERQEIELHYQPKWDVAAHRLVGVEALMRWRRAGQLVSPADFIPLAEESGLINPLTDWALGEAARQAAVWRRDWQFSGSVAVNIPTRFFASFDVAAVVLDVTSRHGVPASTLQLEITETGLMKDIQAVMPKMTQINRLGVALAIDDFGTGYSSLAYLTRLPITELKVDISFVRELGTSPQSDAVVSAIVALSRSLDLNVIAEGVETPGQRDQLLLLGCHQMQGYLFARPMLADDFSRWVQAQQTSVPSTTA